MIAKYWTRWTSLAGIAGILALSFGLPTWAAPRAVVPAVVTVSPHRTVSTVAETALGITLIRLRAYPASYCIR